jgi:hypothetical protein
MMIKMATSPRRNSAGLSVVVLHPNKYRSMLAIDSTMNARDAGRLFDYLDQQGLGDGLVKFNSIISFICTKHISQIEETTSPREKSGARIDVASIVFRKQPQLFEELTQMALNLQKKGRSFTHLAFSELL